MKNLNNEKKFNPLVVLPVIGLFVFTFYISALILGEKEHPNYYDYEIVAGVDTMNFKIAYEDSTKFSVGDSIITTIVPNNFVNQKVFYRINNNSGKEIGLIHIKGTMIKPYLIRGIIIKKDSIYKDLVHMPHG